MPSCIVSGIPVLVIKYVFMAIEFQKNKLISKNWLHLGFPVTFWMKFLLKDLICGKGILINDIMFFNKVTDFTLFKKLKIKIMKRK